MQEKDLRKLLRAYKKNNIKEDELIDKIRKLPFEDIGYAKIDHHRELRKGIPEAILASHKTPRQVFEIWQKMEKYLSNILVTRATKKHYLMIKKRYPDAVFHQLSGCITLKRDKSIKGKGLVLVLAAGTSDLPIAEEAYVTLDLQNNKAELITDVGVAGIHRLFAYKEKIEQARVIIAIAGMEGALPGIVASLSKAPVIAVPTDVGYGSHFGGLSSLLTMLNSCSPGIAVVNINNGYGAACMATLINRLE
jgi:NCAIR mutase (PurE)-related protein